MNIAEYKNSLLNFDLQSFLYKYNCYNSIQLKKIFPKLYLILAQQLAVYTKAAKKHPLMTEKFCFFTSKSYEQSSGEVLAEYKASLFKGNKIIDLTGGLGADDIAFSRKFEKVVSIDCDEALNVLVEINFEKLGIFNIKRITSTAEDFLKKENIADLIYIDADRRTEKSGKRAVTLHGSSPDILSIYKKCFNISSFILLKLSPLTDLSYLKKNLENIKFIKVISLFNEVKEILVLLEKDISGIPFISAVDISAEGIVNEFRDIALKEKTESDITECNYFIDAGNALVKAGLTAAYAADNSLIQLSKQSSYMLGVKELPKPFGRQFKIIKCGEFKKSDLKNYIKLNNIQKANISCKNFPSKPEELREVFALLDGGDDYFFFTTDDKKRKLFIHCVK